MPLPRKSTYNLLLASATDTMDVLLTDDDPQILEGVRRVFERRGHAVATAATAKDALRALERRSFDLLVLDWNLPDQEGVEVVEKLRASGRMVPVLMLTARTEQDDLVRALDAGADDFLPKQSARPDVLLARAEALVRRALYPPPPRRIVAGDILVDEGAKAAIVGGEPLDLAPSELRVLALLAASCGKVLSRAELTAGCWGDGADVTDNALESLIKRLRKKLGPAGDRLQAVRLRGYVLLER
ncbi:MAG: response regulator transcription factor [Myxococcales bacterium]|nr:response regulator transcription factor [Myxococcales bacterium]